MLVNGVDLGVLVFLVFGLASFFGGLVAFAVWSGR
jgi:hypothetical protein